MKTNLTTALSAHLRSATPMVAVLATLATAPSTIAQVREAWAARYGGVGFDLPVRCAWDGAGHIVVAGLYGAGAAGDNPNALTLEYDAQGQVLWSRQYGSTGFDTAESMVLDSAGNVYVTGFSYASASATFPDIATIKYDDNGLQLWVSRFNGPANKSDVAREVAVDGAGNVYVVGWTTNATNLSYDYATVKYDAAGVQQWAAFHAGPANGDDSLSAVGVDSVGNVYVTGSSSTGVGTSDCVTIKYDPSGNQVWLRRLGNAGGIFLMIDLVIDAADNVYVGASGVTAKYDGQGNLLWSQPVGTGTGMVLDSAGSVLVLDQNGLSKLDVTGSLLWSSAFAGPGGGARANALATDVQDGIYVTGFTFGNNQNYLTIKYDSSGNPVWLEQYDGPGTFDRSDQAVAIAVAAPDLVVVTGASAASGGVSGNYYSDWATIMYERATLGVAYCSPANVNSTGAPASAEVIGSAVVLDNDLTLWGLCVAAALVRVFPDEPVAGLGRQPGREPGDPLPRREHRALRRPRADPELRRSRCDSNACGPDRAADACWVRTGGAGRDLELPGVVPGREPDEHVEPHGRRECCVSMKKGVDARTGGRSAPP